MPAFSAEPGMPYWQDLLTPDVQKSTYFYSKLLGWETSGEDYLVAKKEGLPVAGIVPGERPAWVTYFLGGAPVEKFGGKVVASSEVSLGRMQVCQDPAGGLFGLIDPAGEEQFVAAGEPGVPVWYEYSAPDLAAIDFYGDLFDWEIKESDGYYLALAEGAPFLGMRVQEQHAGWQSFFGVANISQARQEVGMLGGEVLAGPGDSPFGPMLAMRDSAGAASFLVEAPEPAPEDFSEADSVLEL
ncbi:VOC family protein [Corynebacterium sp. Marseille-P8863]|uniref:VOC family protein n=1 Tax=Corynebacterium sp. Marseille-P8863 TaxID=2866576 RepID=UPI002264F784|nr:VOC family protein [Corynebacterium sp. Marseille-P8863]